MTATATQTIQPQFRTVDGLSIRLAESEDRGDHALLLSPWPESLFAFEPMWARLAEHAHLVAVDLPGYGHSERRDELLSPRAMGEFVTRLADALGLERPHAVGPDVGAPALLFAAAANPGRFRSLVIGSAATAYPLQVGMPLKDWVEAPDTEAYRSLDPRELIAGFLSSSITRYPLPEPTREDYLSSYEGDRFVETMRYPRAYPADLPILADLLPQIQTPVQIINGAHDPVAFPVNAEYLHQRLPKSKLDLLDSGHFAWEDRADEYAALITRWWAGGYATIGRLGAPLRVANIRRKNHMSSMTSTHRPHTVDHRMTRVDIPTGMAFGSFCKAFEQAVPAFDFAHIRQITENGGTWEDIVAAVAANSPTNDMMRYATLDMTALYATTDHRTKAVEYFVGNHVIADQMVRRDPKILLYAPLRILVHGDADGDAVVSIDRPSTVFASLGVREIDEVGSLLDDKIAAVLRGIGVGTGDALGPDTDQRTN